MKKLVAILLALVLVMGLVACGGPAAKEDDGKIAKVGLCMPTKEQTIWTMQADRLEKALTAAGFEVLVEFAEDDSARQAMQIENMISKGVDALVVVAVDGAALTDACEKAKEAGIVVIAEDRLITNTSAVDYYVTFDLVKMGELQGQFIADALDLANAAGPFNLEIFSGSPDDPNAKLFYDGAMNILKPYMDEGKLVVQSGQVSYEQSAILGWDSAKAQARMDNLLSGFYADKHLDAVLVAADCLAIGVISSLESMGYGTGDVAFPLITGQDAELAAVKSIKAGKQSMTAFLDANKLVEIIVPLVNDLVAGNEVTPDSTYNNDVFEVPTKTYDPYLISAENVDYLVEVGFFTEADING
jgi:putative multiple sugar transport system substrate-binding protein